MGRASSLMGAPVGQLIEENTRLLRQLMGGGAPAAAPAAQVGNAPPTPRPSAPPPSPPVACAGLSCGASGGCLGVVVAAVWWLGGMVPRLKLPGRPGHH